MAEAGGEGAAEGRGPNLDTLTIVEYVGSPLMSEYSCKVCRQPITYERWCHLEVERLAKLGHHHEVIYLDSVKGRCCAIL